MNSQTLTFKKFNFKEFPKKFFEECSLHQLYKKADVDFVSHMKEMYDGKILFEGLTSIVAYINDIPVGVIHCEYDITFKNAIVLENPESLRPKIEKRFNWGFYHLGFVNIFVKEKYRNQSIATQLWNLLEEEKIKQLKNTKDNINPLSVPIFQAQELSYKLIEEKSLYSYVSECDAENYFSYTKQIHYLTNSILLERNGKEYKHRKREPIQIENKKINYKKI